MKRILGILVLCLALPALALAVTEGVIEDAPPIVMESVNADDSNPYLPDASYYAGYGDYEPAWGKSESYVEQEFDGEYFCHVHQMPQLTTGERIRARRLLEAYQAGTLTGDGESVLGAMKNVVVGVYALDPADYDGEKAYVLLPGTCLTDEQILAIIDAYNRLGLVFDPDGLSARCCARGGGIETSRFLTQEEAERNSYMADRIRRGQMEVQADADTALINPELDTRYYNGLPDFTIRPYRRMTDEELVARLVWSGVRDESGELDFDAAERRARRILSEYLGCPLSMQLEYVSVDGAYIPQLFDAQGAQGFENNGRKSYSTMFTCHTEDGVLTYVYADFDSETDVLVAATVMHSREFADGEMPQERELEQAEILAAIAQAEGLIGVSGLTWSVQDVTWTNWGSCERVRAQASQDYWVTVYIGKDDGQVHGVEIQRGTLVEQLPSDAPVNG